MPEHLAITNVVYIGASAADVWRGIVDAEMTKHYVYGTARVGDLRKGAPYAYLADGGFTAVDGIVLEIQPEKRLVISWKARWDQAVSRDRASRVAYTLTSVAPKLTKLELVHDDFDGTTATYAGSVDAWPLMISSLKSLIETGKPLPEVAANGT